MVVTNHPLASAAGAEMLAAGGNAIDATIAALFTLTVVEPMMVGIFGGGMAHHPAGGRPASRHRRPAHGAARHRPDTYTPDPNARRARWTTEGRAKRGRAHGGRRPGQPEGLVRGAGTVRHLPLADVDRARAPPRLARLSRSRPICTNASPMRRRHVQATKRSPRVFLPGGAPIAPARGSCRATTPRRCAASRAKGRRPAIAGALGRVYADTSSKSGAYITRHDLDRYQHDRARRAARHLSRFEIVGPPPPSSGGVHIIQMLNILEATTSAQLGFGTPDTLHLLPRC